MKRTELTSNLNKAQGLCHELRFHKRPLIY